MRRASKYRNRRTNGFDSKLERERYEILALAERAGEIVGLEKQKRIKLYSGQNPILFDSGRHAYYRADFAYKMPSGRPVYEDVKGYDTPTSKLKRAIVAAQGPVKVTIVTRANAEVGL